MQWVPPVATPIAQPALIQLSALALESMAISLLSPDPPVVNVESISYIHEHWGIELLVRGSIF